MWRKMPLVFSKWLYWLLPLVLLPALQVPLSSLESEMEKTEERSDHALNRLLEISNQLAALNTTLRSELENSRTNSRELQNMLEASRKELDALRRELETLRKNSTELLGKAENSQTELAGLRQALRTAESSLTSLELSFEAYRMEAEREITRLKKKEGLWKIGCIAAGAAAVGSFSALLLTR